MAALVGLDGEWVAGPFMFVQGFLAHFMGQPPALIYFLIYAFNPTITGFPSIIAVVVWLPWLEAMTRVLPLADGVGVCISTVIINSFHLISTFILFLLSYFMGQFYIVSFVERPPGAAIVVTGSIKHVFLFVNR